MARPVEATVQQTRTAPAQSDTQPEHLSPTEPQAGSATGSATGQAAGPVLLENFKEGVTTLILNRPTAFNALSEELLDALQQAVASLDEQTRVVVIAASGRAFCGGHDLKEMRGREKPYYDALFARCSRLMQSLLALPQPVIAKVHGMATAAGCQLVANCDLAVASDDCRFAVSGINVGLFCSTPAVALSRNLSRKQAFEMLVTGDFIDAQSAVDKGLINQTVPAAELDGTVQSLCESICAKSPVAIRTGKQLFYRQLELPISEAYALAGETMASNMMAADAAEGIDAFIDKRKPTWTDR